MKYLRILSIFSAILLISAGLLSLVLVLGRLPFQRFDPRATVGAVGRLIPPVSRRVFRERQPDGPGHRAGGCDNPLDHAHPGPLSCRNRRDYHGLYGRHLSAPP